MRSFLLSLFIAGIFFSNNIYGGNYDHFIEQKTLIQAANAHQAHAVKIIRRMLHKELLMRIGLAEKLGLGSRLFSAAAAIPPVCVGYVAGRRLGPAWGLLAMLFFLASPMAVALSGTTHAHVLSRAFFALGLALAEHDHRDSCCQEEGPEDGRRGGDERVEAAAVVVPRNRDAERAEGGIDH